MDAIIAGFAFTDEKIKQAAINMAAPYKTPRGGGLGHAVGMEVHDVGGAQATVLEPGRVFTIEPQFRIEDEHIGLRLEDMLLITESGYENLSAFVPIEIADIEQLMKGPGLSDYRLKH
jgi:Xaa-Pro aminopeptidase